MLKVLDNDRAMSVDTLVAIKFGPVLVELTRAEAVYLRDSLIGFTSPQVLCSTDWVKQDKVPVRVGVDEVRYDPEISPCGNEGDVGRVFEPAVSAQNWGPDSMHGDNGLEVRCRRYDLRSLTELTENR